MTDDIETETGPINSSYVAFFHAAVLLVAPFITAAFPRQLRSDALIVSIVFSIALFWFAYLVKQFVDVSTSMTLVLGSIFLVAALSFLNAIYGDIATANGSVPVVYTLVPFFATLTAGLSGPIGLIYAGTILLYGAYTYISCIAIANLFEKLYAQYGERYLPRALRRRLHTIDAAIDKTAVGLTDNFFFYHQAIGVVLCIGLIGVYALLYVYLLVT